MQGKIIIMLNNFDYWLLSKYDKAYIFIQISLIVIVLLYFIPCKDAGMSLEGSFLLSPLLMVKPSCISIIFSIASQQI